MEAASSTVYSCWRLVPQDLCYTAAKAVASHCAVPSILLRKLISVKLHDKSSTTCFLRKLQGSNCCRPLKHRCHRDQGQPTHFEASTLQNLLHKCCADPQNFSLRESKLKGRSVLHCPCNFAFDGAGFKDCPAIQGHQDARVLYCLRSLAFDSNFCCGQ